MVKVKHGHNTREGTSPTYNSWRAMKQRCAGTKYAKGTPNHERYLKLEVCHEWKDSFSNFLEDVGERPEGKTLDRIDNSKGYYKENVRWADNQQQQRNKSNNVFIEGVLLIDWCRVRGWNYHTVWQWLYHYNYSVEVIKEKGELKWAKDRTSKELNVTTTQHQKLL